MNIIQKANDTIFKIKKQLQSNKNITKLLYHSVPAPLAEADVTAEKIKDIIVTNPVLDYKNSDISHFVSFGVPTIDFGDSSEPTIVKLTISVVCNSLYWELDDNQIRLMTIVDEIYREINMKKYTFSGKLIIDIMEPVIFENGLAGYQIQCYMVEQENENDIN